MSEKINNHQNKDVWVMRDAYGNIEFVGTMKEVAQYGAVKTTKNYNDFMSDDGQKVKR